MQPFEAAQGLQAGLSAMPNAEIAQQRAQQSQLQTAQARLTLQNELRYQQLLKNMPTGQSGGTGDMLMGLAGAAIQSGLPQGVQLYQAAMRARLESAQGAAETVKAQAAQQNARTNAARVQLTQHQQQLNAAYGMLQGVHDPATWQDFTQRFAQMTGDTEYLGMSYDPSTVEGIRSQALTAKGQIDAAMKRLQLQEMAQFHQAELQMRQVSNQLRASGLALEKFRVQAEQIRAKAAAERAERLKKAGTALPVPSPNLVKQATAMITRTYPNLDSDALPEMGLKVAAETQKLMHANPGMDADTAMRLATQQLNNDLVMKTTPTYLGFGPSKTTRTLPPPTPEAKPAAHGGFQEGKIYQDANGNKARYENGKWVPVE